MGEGRERDLVLAPNEFAFISDQTKGNINAYVGPYKTSLANTDQPVFFNPDSKEFERGSLEEVTKLFPTAPEGWYLVMKNPAKDGGHPKTGTVNNLAELQVGHKVNVPGPVAFALWPGQMVKVLRGHHLRSNQYLVVRVYEEESAKANWGKAVIKPQTAAAAGAEPAAPDATPPSPSGPVPDLTMGKHLVIKGTEVSFYIPPTGVEVVRDRSGNYVREAVTLQRLEYCMLLDESGNKRFIQGPAVVFPSPTEKFVVRQGARKFKAIELNEISGLYVKVIAPYEEGGRSYRVGEELFLTGKDQMIYFPRPEHAIIKYGEREIHYAVAIPAGEGRYCLDRQTGEIRLVRGPTMFLADPRREVIVRRVLDPRQVALWFPGNDEAVAYNQALRAQMQSQGPGEHLVERAKRRAAAPASLAMLAEEDEEVAEGFAGDDFTRKTTYSPPRTVTLDTRFDGAVSISVWTGYAVLVVSKTGFRKVVVGPDTHLLEYDQTLEPIELSTGTPKTDDRLYKTAYLRVLHNKVSDVIEGETLDLCRVEVHVSYRVNFEGDPSKWFNVENYVKFLTDHMRSLIRNAIKHRGIEEFYGGSIDIIRDAVLGASGEGGRAGRFFEENGVRIYDVEVLDVKIGDDDVETLLVDAQQSAFSQTLEIAAERRRLYLVQQTEAVKREVLESEAQTRMRELEVRSEEMRKRQAAELAEVEAKGEVLRRSLTIQQEEQSVRGEIQGAELGRRRAVSELDLELDQMRLEQRLTELKGEVSAVVDKAQAVSPDLVAALQSFGDRAMVEKVAESMAPLAILGGKSVAEVLASLLKGTPLEAVASNGLPVSAGQIEG